MNRSILVVSVLLLIAASLIIVKPEHVLAQTPTPTNPPQVTPSSTSTLALTPTPPLTPTSTPIPIPKPLVPEFTVKLIISSSDGNKTIELTIKNQPFDSNNIYHYSFFYNVRTRINGGNWTDVYTPEDGYPTQTNSDYTVLSYTSTINDNGYFTDTGSQYNRIHAPPDAKLDVQVEAMIGYRDRGVYQGGIMPYVFKGETSGWSNTQTITVNANTSSLTASLSESASALNHGNTVNFTVSADGGMPPYTFAWYIDSQLAETSNSQYFSTDSQAVGSHHVYVQVTDVDNNSATTLTVEFNVLPVSSTSPSLSPTQSNSPTQQLTSSPKPSATTISPTEIALVTVIVVIAVSVASLAISKRHKRQT